VGRGLLPFFRSLDFDHGKRRRRSVRIGIFQEPAKEQFFVTFQARLPEKKNTEQQDYQHQ
jgi:hypothetical protein